MTGGATFVVIGLVVWTLRGMVKGQAARVFAAISMGLLLNEALLGALLVKLGYVTGNQSAGRVVMLSIHLSNTLLLLGALTLTARMVATGQQWRELWGSGRRMGLVVLGLVATLEVGVSGSLAALGDTLFPATTLRGAFAQDFAAGSPWLLRLRWVHPASAVLAVVFVVWILQRARRQGVEWRWVAGLLGMQFLLGGADILLLAPTWMQIVHLLGADLYWISLVVVSAQALWPVETTAGATRSSLLPWREAEQAGPTVIVGPAS